MTRPPRELPEGSDTVREFAQFIVNLEARAEYLLDENRAAGLKVYVEDTMRAALIEADIDPDERLVFDLAARARQALALPQEGSETVREALKPFAEAAKTLDVWAENGEPFTDPDEVLWAGDTGVITVADFRRASQAFEKGET